MSWLEDIGDQQLIEHWRKCSDWGTARVKKKKDDMLQQNQLCGYTVLQVYRYTIHQFVAENLKKINDRQIFVISRRIGKDVTFGASAQTMRKIKIQIQIFWWDPKLVTGRTRHSHTFTAEQFQSTYCSTCFGLRRQTGASPNNMQTSKRRSEAQTLLLQGSCAAPAPPCCPTFKGCTLICFFFLFQHHAITAPIFTTRSCWLPTYNHSSLHFPEQW